MSSEWAEIFVYGLHKPYLSKTYISFIYEDIHIHLNKGGPLFGSCLQNLIWPSNFPHLKTFSGFTSQLQDIRDLLLMSWCQILQGTFVTTIESRRASKNVEQISWCGSWSTTAQNHVGFHSSFRTKKISGGRRRKNRAVEKWENVTFQGLICCANMSTTSMQEGPRDQTISFYIFLKWINLLTCICMGFVHYTATNIID